ncbi:hypothetical protein HYH03_007284 [Edaphochlamys debaryana]|uniref:Uncharacterized protein n=1 Tax=Edaphochlamys debaryana TaxID=47281 RepID=A0A836C015_9CHLO|nr:hypothetical protein HYH03_007284 [Edaphochlamys debaryana]|eukprot:KAG2494517.1 hypothetical protein HYH03_007284 [Edaphochlamys debaryana]
MAGSIPGFIPTAAASSSPETTMSAADVAATVKLEEVKAKLEQKRQRALAPYLVPPPDHGVVGSSKYADRLRKQVVAAARDKDRHPVLIIGEPGLEKSNVAALIHFNRPSCRTTPMAALDCSRLDGAGAELFGRGDRAGLVEAVGNGTLLLTNVHKMPPALIPKLNRLCAEGTYRPAAASQDVAAARDARAASGSGSGSSLDPNCTQDLPQDILPSLRASNCRVILTAESHAHGLDEKNLTVIKVPPLRLRPADVKFLQRYYLTQIARRKGTGPDVPVLALTPAAMRQLANYTWPGNNKEVAQVVERAVLQAGDDAAGSEGRLNEDVFWFAQAAKDRFRVNLLAAFPWLRTFLRSEVWPEGINFKFTAIVFPIVVALLLLGPQERYDNAMLAVFWDYWWPLVFISYPLLGRVWCAVCPFMIYGEITQKWRIAMGAPLLKWPRDAAEKYGPPFLFSLFAGILVWEEVWDLPHSAYLSGWLLILITAGAVICSSIWERRLWCRYLCPIGGMNGLFAKLSMTEVRGRTGVCSSECTTYHCYKGGCAQPPMGLESPGCPLYSHPAQLADNRNCINCMGCLKACPNGSVEFRLRPPGSDLWSGHTASPYEVALMFMLLGAVYLHFLPDLSFQMGVDAFDNGLTQITPAHVAASLAVLAVPGTIAYGADVVGRFRVFAQVNHAFASLRQGKLPELALPSVSLSVAASPRTDGANGAEAPDATAGAKAAAAAKLPAGAARSGEASAGDAGAGSGAAGGPSPPSFVELSYGYLPLVWAATLSYYLQHLLGEAGDILPITAAMIGWDDGVTWMPSLICEPHVIKALQGSMLTFGALASVALTRRIANAPWSTFVPQLVCIGLFTAELWYLIPFE